MQARRCVVCGRTLVPAEEGAPANAYVLAHQRCTRLDTNDRVPSPGRAPMRWP